MLGTLWVSHKRLAPAHRSGEVHLAVEGKYLQFCELFSRVSGRVFYQLMRCIDKETGANEKPGPP